MYFHHGPSVSAAAAAENCNLRSREHNRLSLPTESATRLFDANSICKTLYSDIYYYENVYRTKVHRKNEK